MDALLQSSKLLKHWPSILLGIFVALAIKYIRNRRCQPVSRNKLDGEEDIAGMKFTDVIIFKLINLNP